MSLNAISLLLVVAILSLVHSTYSQIFPHDEPSLGDATPVSSSSHPAISYATVTTTTAAAAAAAAPTAASAPVAPQSDSFVAALMETLSMVFISELGDNTFFIAAIMAMKFPRMAVFLGATLALVVMTFVSVLCGSALSMVPKIYTYYCSLLLLWIFGLKMIVDGLRMPENSGVLAAEYGNQAPPHRKRRGAEKVAVENVNLIDDDGDAETGCCVDDDGGQPDVDVLVTFWQIFAQAFTLTFLGEWGDRSQIATMVLTLNVNKYGIVLGSFVGHVVTTGLAVICGRLVAQKISVKKVSVAGGVVFIVFAFVTFLKNNTVGEFA